jgi:hypothetical protein
MTNGSRRTDQGGGMGPRPCSARLMASDSVTISITRRWLWQFGQIVMSSINTLLRSQAHGCLPHAYGLVCLSLSALVSQSSSCAGSCGSAVAVVVDGQAGTTWFRRLQFGARLKNGVRFRRNMGRSMAVILARRRPGDATLSYRR